MPTPTLPCPPKVLAFAPAFSIEAAATSLQVLKVRAQLLLNMAGWLGHQLPAPPCLPVPAPPRSAPPYPALPRTALHNQLRLPLRNLVDHLVFLCGGGGSSG